MTNLTTPYTATPGSGGGIMDNPEKLENKQQLFSLPQLMTIMQKDNAVHLAKQTDDVGHETAGLNRDNKSELIHRLRTK